MLRATDSAVGSEAPPRKSPVVNPVFQDAQSGSHVDGDMQAHVFSLSEAKIIRPSDAVPISLIGAIDLIRNRAA